MYIRGRISQRASRPEATSPIGPARLPPIQPEPAQVVSSPLRFRSRATHCCIRWQPLSRGGTALGVGRGPVGDRRRPRSRRCRWRKPAGQPSVSRQLRESRAIPPTACPSYRETSDNSPPGPPSPIMRQGLSSQPLLCRAGARNRPLRNGGRRLFWTNVRISAYPAFSPRRGGRS